MAPAANPSPARPVLVRAACTGCGTCARGCAAEAITLVPRGVLLEPRFDLERCTRCHACHEGCPSHAIELQEEPPARAWPGVGLWRRLLGRAR